MSWGYLVPSDGDPVRWFKLLLVKEEDLDPALRSSEFILKARQFMCVEGKTPQIWSPNTFACWRYGPEAVALSTLSEPGRKINKEDIFLVCDAGGGTVGLITDGVSNTSPVMLEEAVEGRGGLCGGIFVDQAFEVKCKKCLGRRWDRLSKNDINDVMREDWEREAFTDGKTSYNKRDPIIRNARMMFTRTHVKGIFDGVFKYIETLIDDQIKSAKAKAVSVTDEDSHADMAIRQMEWYLKRLKDWVNPGDEWLKRLDFDIEMVTLEFNIYVGDRKIGASNVAVTFQ
ncbi:hypothetical protein FHL15_005171 [Xylaria flabelliformis]|uniref:Uncharacterized protein n=1 Tax=Xylaria flabelliformis TaxID=2512241 RepID=A0A553I1K9_9PEZI|nr:hypothetical protein FHL15_005171 [Xylaria flabelliformis]